MTSLVEVLFLLYSRIVEVLNLHVQAIRLAGPLDKFGQPVNRVLLGELIQHPEHTWLGGIEACQFHATQRIDDVQITSSLTASAVNRQWMADNCLYAEPIQGCSPHIVVIETRSQSRVESGLSGLDAVDDTLVQIGRSYTPDPARELDVVAVVNFGQVVEGAGSLREQHALFAALVLDVQPAFLDFNVRRTVLSHRAQFN